MTATRDTVDAILKEMYEGSVNNQLNEEQIASKRLEQTADGVVDNIGGKHVVFPVRSKRNSSISYRGENIQLADPGQQGYARAIEDLKYGYGRFQITGPAMELAETNEQAFMSALDGEMDGLKGDTSKDQNRITWGHPDSATAFTGIIGKVSAVATAVHTVDNPYNYSVGMKIDVINSADDSIRGTETVVDVDYDAGEITLNAAVTDSAADDYHARQGNYGEEPYGLLALVGNVGTVHGIDSEAAGNGYWKSTVDASTTTLTEQAMIATCDKIRQAGGGRPTAIFCSLGVRRAYYNIMISQRRYIEPKNFPGGLVGLSFNHGKEIPVVEDPDAPASHMLFLEEKEVKVFRSRDWYFEDKDGAVLKWKPDYDVFQGLLKKYWQMGTHKRNAHGLMNNITEPVA